MSQAYTLDEVLAGLGAASRGVRFLLGEGRETFVSYADLLARARGLLAVLQRRGVKPGDPLLVFLRNNVAFVDVFWACQLGGLVPVPLSVGAHSEYLHKLEAVAHKFDAPFLFTQNDLWQRCCAGGAGRLVPVLPMADCIPGTPECCTRSLRRSDAVVTPSSRWGASTSGRGSPRSRTSSSGRG